MKSFSRKTVLGVGLLAATTMLGVYSATASSGETMQSPPMLRSDVAPPATGAADHKVIRIVGPQFLPDNGDVKLLGAAAERAGRH